MRELVLGAARDAGRRPEDVTCCYNVEVRVDEAPQARPSLVSGSAGAVAERLVGLLDLGFDSLSLAPSGPGEDEQIELLGREVLPAVRAAT
jgi:alkanesulfonate monooxygenase SsuD/methylene tetrahydromethanopterin reductase-like flavin-dependent oxidoreductase (luciferase family)